MGGLELAEKQYLEILGMLRKVRGPADDTVCLMLDHLAEFYLETRSFDRAHEVLAEAIQLKRSNIQALSAGQADPTAARTRISYRSHLADSADSDQARSNWLRAISQPPIETFRSRLHLQ